MKNIDISVVIPTYNRKDMLRKALACLTNQDTQKQFSYEVVVVDDISDDGTKEVVHDLAKESPVPLRWVLGKGRGVTHAYNVGVGAASGDWIAFFDDDQLTHSNWLYSLYTAAKEQNADFVGGPIALEVPDDVRKMMGPVYLDMCGETHDITYPEQYRDKNPLPPGGNRMVRSSVFQEIGKFDETFLTGGADRNFQIRAVAAGYTTGWAHKADIKHCIPIERITPKHMKWYSLQWGCSFAYNDWKRYRGLKTSLMAIARVGQALLVHLPLIVVYTIQGNQVAKQDRQALWWRAVGFVRKTLSLFAPALFPQESFFSRVEFRRSRDSETKSKD